MSDGKMSIDEINELIEDVLTACLLLYSQLGHDFGSVVTTGSDKKFKLTFQRIER